VVPPSVRPDGEFQGNEYRFLAGSWDDLPRLPKVNTGSLSLAPAGLGADGAEFRQLEGQEPVAIGRRNTQLFKQLMRIAGGCQSMDDLTMLADAVNSGFTTPLPRTEVARVVKSAWGYQVRGENWTGKEGRVTATKSEVVRLAQNPDALALLFVLRGCHAGGGRGETFAVSPKAMWKSALISTWSPKKYSAAIVIPVNNDVMMVPIAV